MQTESNVDVFDISMRESNEWLRDVMDETGLDSQQALAALRAVLHAIRDETTVRQSSYLVAQMPALIRGFYFEGWDPSRSPSADHDTRRFLARVHSSFGATAGELDDERIVRGVFHVLERRIPDAAAKIKRMLPRELHRLLRSSVAEEVVERKDRLAGEKRLAATEALHAQAGHERGASGAPEPSAERAAPRRSAPEHDVVGEPAGRVRKRVRLALPEPAGQGWPSSTFATRR